MKRKTIVLAVGILISLLSVLYACGNGSYAMTDFIVDYDELKRTYEVGDDIDFSKLIITAKFNDGTSQIIPLDKVEIRVDGTVITDSNKSEITKSVGEKYVEVLYSDKKISFKLIVREKYVPQLTGIRINAENVKKEYVFGDAVSFDGLKIFAVYDETDETEISLDDVGVFMGEERINGNLNKISASVGRKAIKFVYNLFESSPVVFEVSDELKSLTIDTSGLKTNYNVGDEVANPGLVAVAEYKSGVIESLEDVKYYLGDSEVDFASLSANKGEKTISAKISYEGTTAEAKITYSFKNFVTAISINTNGNILSYLQDNPISISDFDSVKINVEYKDTQDNTILGLIADGVRCLNASGGDIDFSSLTRTDGTKRIIVSYANKTAEFSITVLPVSSALSELRITSAPAKTTYTAGETGVSLEGLTIKAVYNEELVYPDEDISINDFEDKSIDILVNDKIINDDLDEITRVSVLGENEVTVFVKYKSRTASFSIMVTNSVKSIALNTDDVKTSYRFGEKIDFSNIIITATCDYGTLTKGFSDVEFYDGATKIDNFDTLTATVSNSRTVTVKYQNKTADFNIQVADYIVNISVGGITSFSCIVDTTEGAKETSFPGLEVKVNFASGDVQATSAYTLSDNEKDIPGLKKVKVEYQGFSATFDLKVIDKLISITVKEDSIPTVAYGAKVVLENIVVVGKYAYAGDKIINIKREGGGFLYGRVSIKLKKDGVWETIDHQSQEALNTIAQKSGTREIELTCKDENEQSATVVFSITITEPKKGVNGFERPKSLTTYESTKANAEKNQNNVNTKAFEGSFFTADDNNYLVGDDNAYKFLPILKQIDIENGQETVLASFPTVSEVTLIEGSNEIKLTATTEGDRRIFKNGTTKYVVENYKKNEFTFSDAALDKIFRLSVLPDPDMFDYKESLSPVKWTVKIVDGFNITDSRQLCVMEQSTRTIWDGIKSELGLSKVKPKSIVLHQNTKITKDSIPSDFYYTLSDSFDISYKKDDVTKKPEDWGLSRTYLWDGEYGLFEYYMSQGDRFTINGNYFDIDMSTMPMVAAFEPNGITAPGGDFSGTYYGQYMSKVSFLEVHGQATTSPTSGNDEFFRFKNFAVKGNAAIDQLLVAKSGSSSYTEGEDNPVYGGGLIFVKSVDCTAEITNIRAYRCFIPFYSRDNTKVTYTKVKAYDSFQNAMFINGDSDNTLTNCHMKRAGGPLFILTENSKKVNDTDVPLVPVVKADTACKLESFVSGQSQWFVTYGASSSVSQLKPTDYFLNQYFGRTFIQGDQFNVIAVSVKEGGPFSGGIGTQAFFSYGSNDKLDRMNGSGVFTQMQINMGYVASNGGTMPVTFSVGDYLCGISPDSQSLQYASTTDGRTFSAVDVSTKSDIMSAFRGTDESGNYKYNYVAINVGGMGILTGLYEYKS